MKKRDIASIAESYAIGTRALLAALEGRRIETIPADELRKLCAQTGTDARHVVMIQELQRASP
jgi:hypothetical protein